MEDLMSFVENRNIDFLDRIQISIQDETTFLQNFLRPWKIKNAGNYLTKLTDYLNEDILLTKK